MSSSKERHPLSLVSLTATIIGGVIAPVIVGVIVWYITQSGKFVTSNIPKKPAPEQPKLEATPQHSEPPDLSEPVPPNTVDQPQSDTASQLPERMIKIQPGPSFYHGRSKITFSVEFFNPVPEFRFAKLTTLSPDQTSLTETVTGAGDVVEFVSNGTRYRATVLGLDFTTKTLTINLSPLP